MNVVEITKNFPTVYLASKESIRNLKGTKPIVQSINNTECIRI